MAIILLTGSTRGIGKATTEALQARGAEVIGHSSKPGDANAIAADFSDPPAPQVLWEEALDRATLAHVAEALGAMEAVLEITSEYIKTRQQFGQPIGKFQALQHRMAEMFVEVQEMRSILLRGIAHVDAGPAERRMAVSAAKVMLGQAARFVGGQGIQLHGGIGVTDEYQVGHYYKRLLVLDKRYGDADWHLERFIAAQQELDAARRRAE